ncbi:hypothetical protein KSF_002540 [Reticulibacter mediterranei]|uniref:Uncharacterized protein n=1 Tax=Reticulibacter mediterranei TaxID=2778369 RepID=A0A8J3I955_9CHLR|nr:hypothetical protein [Reticulibacter mediterranei]GHO90206.1 hypothetical protein KSF_002540 [Reticulibacter mediterranei]
MAAGTFPEAKKRRWKRSSFDQFEPYVFKGERNGIVLWCELLAQGAPFSERMLYRYLEVLEQIEVNIASLHRLQKFTANTAVWLFVQDPCKLDEIEQEALAAFRQVSPTLSCAYDLIQYFLLMVHRQEGAR